MAEQGTTGSGSGITQWVSIRGNIKQQYLPFVLKPASSLNANITDDNQLTDGPQYFSFRKKKADDYKAGFARINICPSVIRSPEFGMYFNQDVSNRLVYGYGPGAAPVTINGFMNQLPALQIREFQVDSKLDQFLNFFYDLLSGASSALFKDFDVKDAVSSMGQSSGFKAWKAKFSKVIDTIWDFTLAKGMYETANNMFVDAEGKSWWEKALLYTSGAATVAAAGAVQAGAASRAAASPPLDVYMRDFPFVMYYRLQSCTTTNVYEVPCVNELLWKTNGNAGWNGDNQMGLHQLMGKKESMFGKVLNMITGLGDVINRVRINYMPRWDADKGSAGEAASVTVSFDLFNDTADAAMKNFIFVNTLVPNNMWMQYGFFVHSPCLYDVKIEGVQRMFACSGNFEVKAGGIMRTPMPQWVRALCTKYANTQEGKENGNYNPQALADSIINNKLIKIPDVYTVTMTFTSLLPVNFNNFLFNFTRDSGMETYKNSPAHQPSAFSEVFKGIKETLQTEIDKAAGGEGGDQAQ